MIERTHKACKNDYLSQINFYSWSLILIFKGEGLGWHRKKQKKEHYFVGYILRIAGYWSDAFIYIIYLMFLTTL